VNAAQVLAMQAQGHEIGAHSNSHADLTLSTPTDLANEVDGSKTALENAGVNFISSFAYPYGNYNNAVIQALVNAGYEAGRGAYPDGENYKDTNKYELRVVDVQLLTPVATVKTWIDQAIANKSWVILMYHQIDSGGDQYSTLPQNFQEIVNYAQSVGIMVVTNRQGVALMN
ncbi:polysaccharide deacetylase family protein, partial [Candidatus Dojkabacteria bacterium]|nr:polysaccharide deacetylase family protein [Candidatus Dojkabacteria bacterium]